MLEFEKKIILTEPEYRFLAENRYAGGETSVHINHYYDTEDFKLNGKGITCRIREKKGIFTATIKEHNNNRQDCSIESSCRVRNEYDDILFKDMGIGYQGSLETIRTSVAVGCGVKVMLDHNNYLDREDYELEIEYESETEPLAMQEIHMIANGLFLHKIVRNINAFTSRIGRGKNKSERFFGRKAGLKIQTDKM